MPLAEFYDWMEFFVLHPFPADIIDRQGAMQQALLANVNRDPQTPAYEPRRFLVIRDLPVAPAEVPAPTAQRAARPAPRAPTIAERMRAMIREV